MKSVSFEFHPEGVSEKFAEKLGIPFEYITSDYVRGLVLPRRFDEYKGSCGHALLVCGSRGMGGAAVLAAGGALRSGCGLVTVHIPEDERFALTANYPSALVSLDSGKYFTAIPDGLEKYKCVGVGCGIGQVPATSQALRDLLIKCFEGEIPMVLDADALNIISQKPDLLPLVTESSVITPHAGELKRLIGNWQTEEEKIQMVIDFSAGNKLIVVVKGPNTMVCVQGKKLAFNSTGNSGMAKGGSGDVLTGFITGLIARGYSAERAAEIGVFVHGLAGDKARDYFGAEGMNSADIIDFLAEALLEIQ